MARTIATWMNEDKTLGAILVSDGTLGILQRENSGQVWPPPMSLNLNATTVDMSAVLIHLDPKQSPEWRFLDS